MLQTQETRTVQRLRPSIQHRRFKDLEEVQCDELEESEGEMAKDRQSSKWSHVTWGLGRGKGAGLHVAAVGAIQVFRS